MAGMDVGALTNASAAREALAQVIPDAGTRDFVLTNLVMDPKTKQYKWKVNVEAISAGLRSGALSQFTPPGDSPFEGPTLWIKGGKSNYVLPDEHSAAMKTFFPAFHLHTIDSAGCEKEGVYARD